MSPRALLMLKPLTPLTDYNLLSFALLLEQSLGWHHVFAPSDTLVDHQSPLVQLYFFPTKPRPCVRTIQFIVMRENYTPFNSSYCYIICYLQPNIPNQCI